MPEVAMGVAVVLGPLLLPPGGNRMMTMTTMIIMITMTGLTLIPTPTGFIIMAACFHHGPRATGGSLFMSTQSEYRIKSAKGACVRL
jgi:hypothetical protein